MNTTGDHNLALSIWLVRPPPVGSSPGPADIAAEFMVWTDSVPAAFVPGGTKRDEITVDGTAWEVWASEDWGDASGANSNRWTYIAYRTVQSTRSASYDARKLIADAVNRGLVSSDL